MTCLNCGKPVPSYRNYCELTCQVEHAKKLGGKVIAPNGLPITCVRADNTVLEHPFADHPTYRYPVLVDYVGPLSEGHYKYYQGLMGRETLSESEVRAYMREAHALIYTDRHIAVTLDDEGVPCMFSEGVCVGVHHWKKGEWAVTQDSWMLIANT